MCVLHMKEVLYDPNSRHPKQHDKLMINDVLERMSVDNPKLLMNLLAHDDLNRVLDSLIGFARFGAVTTHWMTPGGDRQKSHVDYPCHVQSGKFWESNPDLLERYFTPYQLNHLLPHFSVQTLIASDRMGQFNGSTEVIPGSHIIKDIDIRILGQEFYNNMEPKFINAELEQGDVLIFQ